MKTETVTYRRVTITLYQDESGDWGWIIGSKTMVAAFAYRTSAFDSAKQQVDMSK